MRYLWFVLCLLISGPLSAQDESGAARDLAQRLYRGLEETVRAQWDEKTTFAIEAAHARGTLNAQNAAIVRAAIAGFEYQYLIDRLVCAEQTFNRRGALVELERCSSNRQVASAEMFSFMSEYARLDSLTDLALTRCSAKARLFSLEIRYPPYEFLKVNASSMPQALDARMFMECVRSRL
jgi:hypothetical protein